MRGLHDSEVPAQPEAPWVQSLPWVLRPRLVALTTAIACVTTVLALVDNPILSWVALALRWVLLVIVLSYCWHILEHSLLGTLAPPRLRWLADKPSLHSGLGTFLIMIASVFAGGGLLFAALGIDAAAALVAAALLLLSPWLCLTVLLSETPRRFDFPQGLEVMEMLGRCGVGAGVLLALALTPMFWLMVVAGPNLLAWMAAIAWALLASRGAGLLMQQRSAFLDVETEEDREIEVEQAVDRKRLDRLFQRLHLSKETGDVPAAVACLEEFLAEDDYSFDQRMLYELGQWRWPRLHSEHARRVVQRLLGAGNERAAWSLALEIHADDAHFLPVSLDDLARLAEVAAGPGERRAVLAMVRTADRSGQGRQEDPRLARVWLAAAEAALQEGDMSLARVWISRAETRFPDALQEPGRQARRDVLRRVLEDS